MSGLVSNAERFALAALTWAVEPGDARLGAMTRLHGPVKTLEMLQAGRLPAARGAAGRRRAATWRVPGRAEVAAAFHAGLRLVCPGDSEWPAGLDDLGEAAPLALWARGSADLAEACARSVAFTGVTAHRAGADTARVIAAEVSGRGWTVVSGGGRSGAAALQGALGAGGTTVVVAPGGLDRHGPRGQRPVPAAVTERGVLVSECPPGWKVTRTRLLASCRLITALGCGTVLCAFGRDGSAEEAVWHALALGRPLMAAPGSRARRWRTGSSDDGRAGSAVLVTSGREVIEVITACAGPSVAGQGEGQQ